VFDGAWCLEARGGLEVHGGLEARGVHPCVGQRARRRACGE
jgi:hypothetical protein